MEDKVQRPVVENSVGAGKGDTPRKKVLLSFVGMRDPYNDNVKTKPCTTKTPPQPKPMGFFSRIGQYLHGNPPTPVASAPVIVAPSDAPRPREDWGSILTICDGLKPDIVFLFPSSKEKAKDQENQTEDKARQVQEILRKQEESPECYIFPLDVDNVTNHEKLYISFKNNCLKVLEMLHIQEHPESLLTFDFCFNTSSGTQQMSQVAQLYLSVSQIKPQFYQCTAPKFAEGKRVQPVNTPLVAEASLLARLESNAERGHYHSVVSDCDSLSELTFLPGRRSIAETLKKIFGAYEKMDLMRYKKAFEEMQKIEFTMESPYLPDCEKILDNQRAFLDHLKEDKEEESTHNLVDLYFNLLRAFRRGNYADVLARFWRLREGILYFRLFQCGINKRRLRDSAPDSLKKLQDRCSPGMVDWSKMYFKESMGVFSNILIDIFDDIDLQSFEEKFEKNLDHLRYARNKSIAGHGMRPVDPQDAVMCVKIGKELIHLIPGGKPVYEQYPFTPENAVKLAGLLKKV